MRPRAAVLVVPAVIAIFALSYVAQRRGVDTHDASSPSLATPNAVSGAESARSAEPTPVALNRGPDVVDGFRGDVHPLLFGTTRLNVTAQWTPVGHGRDQLH